MTHLLPCQSVHAYAVLVIVIVGALNGGGWSCASAADGRVGAKVGGNADTVSALAWRDGKDFQRQLQLPGPISWSDQSLRQGLKGVAIGNRICRHAMTQGGYPWNKIVIKSIDQELAEITTDAIEPA